MRAVGDTPATRLWATDSNATTDPYADTDGATLAAKMVKFHDLHTISGTVSFSPSLHTVFGRQYRVIEINNNKAKLVGLVKAKVIPKI